MFPDIKPGDTSGSAGWTCAVCGFWVQSGMGHACPNMQPNWNPTIFTYTAPGRDAEIIELLKRIIELLEAKE